MADPARLVSQPCRLHHPRPNVLTIIGMSVNSRMAVQEEMNESGCRVSPAIRLFLASGVTQDHRRGRFEER